MRAIKRSAAAFLLVLTIALGAMAGNIPGPGDVCTPDGCPCIQDNTCTGGERPSSASEAGSEPSQTVWDPAIVLNPAIEIVTGFYSLLP